MVLIPLRGPSLKYCPPKFSDDCGLYVCCPDVATVCRSPGLAGGVTRRQHCVWIWAGLVRPLSSERPGPSSCLASLLVKQP
jgi:hypothetical protein